MLKPDAPHHPQLITAKYPTGCLMPPSAALQSFCHRVRVSAVALNVHRSRKGVVPSTTVHLNQMATAVLAAACENVAPMDANPAPAKAPRIESFKVKRIHADAVLPKRGSDRAAGYDLSSCEDTVVPARGKVCVKTGLQIAIPSGTYARIAPRSGLAAKHFIDTGAGVVDEDYRGEVLVLLFNHSETDFPVKKGDRIAQMILERISTPDVVEVEDLDDTSRGAGGFGSTGGFQKAA